SREGGRAAKPRILSTACRDARPGTHSIHLHAPPTTPAAAAPSRVARSVASAPPFLSVRAAAFLCLPAPCRWPPHLPTSLLLPLYSGRLEHRRPEYRGRKR